MTLPEAATTALPPETPKASATAPVAVRFEQVSKVYRLYGSPREQVMDSLGLNRLLFRGRRSAFQEFHALRDINLTVWRGERIGVIGRNGAGKTTLLKLMTGNFAPTSGTVEVAGSLQALMQTGLGFHPEFSGFENIRASLNYSGLVGAEFEAGMADVIDFVELGEFLHQPMKTYSMGMGARLLFAAATAIKPDILIVDEVLGAGDAYFSAKSAARMRELTSKDCTLLLVTHSTPQILQFCSRAIWLDEGRVVMDGPAIDVVGAYEVDTERRVKALEKLAEETSNAQAVTITVPSFSEKTWIAEKIIEHEVPSNDRRATEFKVVLENGLSVFRWPSNKGVKVKNLFLAENGVPTTVLHTHRPCSIGLDLDVEVGGELRCRYFFSVFNLEALRLTWITSPIDRFMARQGDTRHIKIDLEPLLLGGGDFILSTSIFDDTDLFNLSPECRYDLLARCMQFRVIEHDGRQSPVFHHPATWSFDKAYSTRRKTLSGSG